MPSERVDTEGHVGRSRGRDHVHSAVVDLGPVRTGDVGNETCAAPVIEHPAHPAAPCARRELDPSPQRVFRHARRVDRHHLQVGVDPAFVAAAFLQKTAAATVRFLGRGTKTAAPTADTPGRRIVVGPLFETGVNQNVLRGERGLSQQFQARNGEKQGFAIHVITGL